MKSFLVKMWERANPASIISLRPKPKKKSRQTEFIPDTIKIVRDFPTIELPGFTYTLNPNRGFNVETTLRSDVFDEMARNQVDLQIKSFQGTGPVAPYKKLKLVAEFDDGFIMDYDTLSDNLPEREVKLRIRFSSENVVLKFKEDDDA